tara:strand:- start:1600 stop:1779 length:180 start_codon:yes stop_codon:yes gene_type:complete
MNPVTKARLIVNEITDNVYSQNKLLELITHSLTIKEIELLFNCQKALILLKSCSEDLKK